MASPQRFSGAIAHYARVCGGTLVAGHSFARYYQQGTVKLIGLHFEHLRCDRAAVCTAAGCLASGLHLKRGAISVADKFICAGARSYAGPDCPAAVRPARIPSAIGVSPGRQRCIRRAARVISRQPQHWFRTPVDSGSSHRAEHAAVSRQRLELRPAGLALVKEQASVRRHRLGRLMPAFRAGNDRSFAHVTMRLMRPRQAPVRQGVGGSGRERRWPDARSEW